MYSTAGKDAGVSGNIQPISSSPLRIEIQSSSSSNCKELGNKTMSSVFINLLIPSIKKGVSDLILSKFLASIFLRNNRNCSLKLS